MKEIAKEIIHKKNCEVIVISLGAAGALLVTATETYKATSLDVNRKSTGDSMVAGIVYSLSNGKNLEQALLYGVACGIAATMNPGTELCNKKDADFLYNLIAS